MGAGIQQCAKTLVIIEFTPEKKDSTKSRSCIAKRDSSIYTPRAVEMSYL
ncbi:hypothetical protein DFR28_1011171 [Arenicella xantha]|uniref:Uncharacterized protein n=1 Tax=Arenicella xantha TaxID=644221 RepID=A0A395JTX3_9GAMM|nr:hypothetical protein DFR28_1011171 [Arenicella xantha]